MSPRQQDIFAPSLIALFLFVIGLWAGRVLALLGVLLMAVTLIGYVWLGHWLDAWLAALGGGVLIASGLWAKR
jgi:hypothetical protein